MLAIGVTREVLEESAAEVGVRAEVEAQNQKGTRHRVKLYPIVPASAWQVDKSRARLCPVCRQKTKITGETTDGRLIGACGDAAPSYRWASGRRWKDERGDSRYQRTSASIMFHEDRRVHAVCWHGFRDYFRAVYMRVPGAVFRTAMDTWKGSEDFEARFRASGHKNIGSQAAPVCAAEACRCPSSGYAG